jgi:hypothetical protein
MEGGIYFTEPLPSNDKRDTHRPVEMGSGAMIRIQSFIKTSSGTQKIIGPIHRQRQHGDSISLLSYIQNKESRLIN